MAFKDWARFFKRGEAASGTQPSGDEPEPNELSPVIADSADSKSTDTGTRMLGEQPNPSQPMIKELEHGLHYVGQVIDRLDRHLETSAELLAKAGTVQDRLPELVDEMSAASAATRSAQESLASHLGKRDEANRAMLHHLNNLHQALVRQQDQHQHELALVMRLQRSGRRLLSVLLLGAMTICLVLFALILAIALRPDLIGIGARPVSSPAPVPASIQTIPADANPAVLDALRSADPLIRDKAREILGASPQSP